MEVQSTAEDEVKSWLAELYPDKISLPKKKETTEAHVENEPKKIASTAVSTSGLIGDAIKKRMKKKWTPGTNFKKQRREQDMSDDEDSKLSHIKSTQSRKPPTPMEAKPLSKSVRRRLKKKRLKEAANNVKK